MQDDQSHQKAKTVISQLSTIVWNNFLNYIFIIQMHPLYTPVEMRENKHQTEEKKKEHTHPRETDEEIAEKRPRRK